MKPNLFYNAIKTYERKTGETVENYSFYEYVNGNFFNPSTNKYLTVLPSGEFIIWAIGEREGLFYFWLDQCCGQMKHFVSFIKDTMRITQTEWILTATQRNPKAHIKKWKMERLLNFDYEFEGRFYYVLKGHVSNLK